MPDAPVVGALNVTETPAPTGFPFASVTVTARGRYAVPTGALCGFELGFGVTIAAGPGIYCRGTDTAEVFPFESVAVAVM